MSAKQFLSATMLASACVFINAEAEVTSQFNNADVPCIAVAGKLLIDLHPDVMLTSNATGNAVHWFNAGYCWGEFGNFGFDGPPAQYPDCVSIDGHAGVAFNGKTWIKGDMVAGPELSGASNFSVEVWALQPKPAPGECLISWADKGELDYPEAGIVASPEKWHHVAIVYTAGPTPGRVLYVDGVEKARTAGALTIATGGVFFVGCASDGARKYTGALSAVRVHSGALTPEQVQHNFKGGIDLGTVFLENIDPKVPPTDPTWSHHTNAGMRAYFSKHFRTMWEPAKDEKGIMTEAQARQQLDDYEQIYAFYTTLGMHPPVVSANREQRGDGIKYKINICNNWDGGAFGGYNGERGCGYPIAAPGIAHAHELGHAYQTQQMGAFPGNYWETHTSWMSKKFEFKGKAFVYTYGAPNFFVSNGRNYYGSFHIFEQLSLDPAFGPLFIAKMWHKGRRDASGRPPFLWQIAETIDPNPATSLADEWVKMARRQITWDYPDADRNPKDSPVNRRTDRANIEPIPHMPGWWWIGKEWAPQQYGFNIVPLEPAAKTVTVDFQGYADPVRGSDWRACLVAVNGKNEARYGTIWHNGRNTMALGDDEKALYLVVACTPSKVMDIEMAGDAPSASFRSLEQDQMPYRMQLEGATPKDVWMPATPAEKGHPHRNGGGFVADTAKVDDTAYVGPNAQVLGTSKVAGNARIEDYAVVRDDATVKDHAVVGGHAMVIGDGVVQDYAKVRDFGTVEGGAVLKNHAKVLEHGTDSGKVSGYATVRGFAHTRGAKVYGSSILDGAYTKENEISNGVWLTWSWGAGKNAGEGDFELGGLYVQYLFNSNHTYRAVDTYGLTHGYLVGNPVIANGCIELNGKDQFVEMPNDVADIRDITVDVAVQWNGGARNQRIFEFAADKGACMYLTPAGDDGVLAFVIRKGGKEQVLKGREPLPMGQMSSVRVLLCEDTGMLYVNSNLVAQSDAITLNPEDIRATACYLGRGIAGDYFAGKIDSISVYSMSLVDKSAPEPSPAQWHIPPARFCDTKAVMFAEQGCDTMGTVEYRFHETTGNEGSRDSGWQKSLMFEATGLKPDKTYAYSVNMRDTAGNEGAPSRPVEVKWACSRMFVPDATTGTDVTFRIEAEHYHYVKPGKRHQWKLLDSIDGYCGDGVLYAYPATGHRTGFYNDPMADASRLDYFIRIPAPGKYYVWVRGNGRYYHNDTVQIGFDGNEPRRLNTGWANNKFRWMKMEKPEPFEVSPSGVHTLSIWMEKEGAVIDKIIVTSMPYDQYEPTKEKDVKGDLVGRGPVGESREEINGAIVEQPARKLPAARWSSLRPALASGTRVVMQARAPGEDFGPVEYQFEETTSGKSSEWQKSPTYAAEGIEQGKEYRWRVKMRDAKGSVSAPSEPAAISMKSEPVFIEQTSGPTVVEAEHFTRNSDAPDGHQWVFEKLAKPYVPPGYASWANDRNDETFSGDGYMQSRPVDGEVLLVPDVAGKARLDYDVKFASPGPHYIWVRGSGIHWLGDSIRLGLDFATNEWGKDLSFTWTSYKWLRSDKFDVSPGLHTINVWMAEDGVMVDKCIITTDEKYVPVPNDAKSGAPIAKGPEETARK